MASMMIYIDSGIKDSLLSIYEDWRKHMENQPEKIIFKDRQDKAKSLVYGCMKSIDDCPVDFTKDDVFVVWFCKTLQNWKAIVSASYKGAPLCEVTYNGDKQETYVDIYRKLENVRFPD